MIETREDKTNEKLEFPHRTIEEEWKKYNKRMDGLIDDAEIEAEIEAEKKIRSKNSRLATISTIGVVLLVLLFITVQQASNVSVSTANKNPLIEKTPLSTKDNLANSQESQLIPETATPLIKQTKVSRIQKKTSKQTIKRSNQKDIKIKKTYEISSVKTKNSTLAGNHYVQLGAFSIKKNAELLSKVIESKGFKTVISVRDTKSAVNKTYIVRIEGLVTKNEAKKTRQMLANYGFKNSFIQQL